MKPEEQVIPDSKQCEGSLLVLALLGNAPIYDSLREQGTQGHGPP